ncbi:DUF4242 domain-containing protein [Mycobacterium sp. NBC_00419]|uniref:hypothetical protein n=1 Tax=Mycobacterium sp. NBC_00419 TaxID=2975989 RepID=UPI002E1BB116
MSVPDGPARRFLVEWYSSALVHTSLAELAGRLAHSAAGARTRGTGVSVVLTVAVPDDEMVFGVFRAETADDVGRVCQEAGCPVDRITGGVTSYVLAEDDPLSG